MGFLYEKQTRRFFIFLAAVCVLQSCILGACGILQAQDIRRILVERELAAASYLLEQDVEPALVAAAWNHTEATKEGGELLQMIGHTKDTQSYLLLLLEQTSIPLVLMLLLTGVFFGAVLLSGAVFFFRRREQFYWEAEKIIGQYAENRFERHLPAGETGAIYQLFGSIEQLAMSLQAKNEMEHKAKRFLKDMISNISHQHQCPDFRVHRTYSQKTEGL